MWDLRIGEIQCVTILLQVHTLYAQSAAMTKTVECYLGDWETQRRRKGAVCTVWPTLSADVTTRQTHNTQPIDGQGDNMCVFKFMFQGDWSFETRSEIRELVFTSKK